MILSVHDIHKSFRNEKVLSGVSFTIKKPEIIALVGPNGSGKSTLMNIITNLLTADRGEVTILNKGNHDPMIFKEIAFMQDNSILYDYLTGYDHLHFIASLQGISKNRILQTAKKVGSDGYLHKKVANYSLGMKQHLLLTMAILNEPKLLLLDEPLNGLDPTSAIRVRELLLSLHQEGMSLFLSSHHLAEIDRVTSNILFLKDGRLIKEDISRYENNFYQLIVDNPFQAKKVLEKEGMQVELIDNSLQVYLADKKIDHLFSSLNQSGIVLEDIEKKVFGSEDRYRNIFK